MYIMIDRTALGDGRASSGSNRSAVGGVDVGGKLCREKQAW